MTSAVDQLKSGVYQDVKEVVILGGEAVISSKDEEILKTTGVISADYDVARIVGTTGTGTAVEAINYFYGPGVVDEVTLVTYKDDSDKSYNDVLHLAAELDNPIIPIPEDVEGLPADVVETVEKLNINNVEVVGDFQSEKEVKNDLSELKVGITNEINGNSPEELEGNLDKEITDNFKSGEEVKLIFVENGDIPPALSDGHIVYYKDENNDNIDDDTGVVLDGIGKGTYDKLREIGVKFDDIRVTGNNLEGWEKFKESIEGSTSRIKVDLIKYENSKDVVKINDEFSEKEAKDISRDYKEWNLKYEDLVAEHKAEFANALPTMLETFKSYYANEKEKLSSDAIALGAKIIDESSKDDSVSAWKLMHEFANLESHDNYVKECQSDSDCRNDQIELEKVNVDEKIEKLIGTDRAREVANLDVGKKVGLLETTTFVPPGKESEFRDKIDTIISEGGKVENLQKDYIEKGKEEAYQKYTEELKKEYETIGKKDEAAKLTSDQVKSMFDNRLKIESEAYLSGVVKYQDFINPEKRAEAMARMEEMQKNYFDSKGVSNSQYLTSEDWKTAYDKYSKDGKLSDDDVKKYESAVTAYKTWDETHPGIYYDPKGSYWDAKSGQYSFTDNEGKVVAGVYDTKAGTYTYTNEKGELIQGNKNGDVKEYKEDYGSWKKNEDGTWSGPKGESYIPPSSYNPITGTYDYRIEGKQPDGYVVQCGSKGCSGGIYTGPGSTWTPPEGWDKSADGKSWVSPDGHEYSASTSYYSSGSATGGTGASGGGAVKDSFGNTWTQGTDGTWSSSGGTTYSPSTGTYSGGGTAGGTYTGTYEGGSYSSGGTGGTYSGSTGTYSSGTGTYSGYSGSGSYSGGYSGGDTIGSGSGSYSGGSYSGGDAGGGGGGGGGSPAPMGFVISDIEGKKLLAKWLGLM
ncbi:hypothetical protein HYW75_02315 [Candidatus Pacearchaeota archaeon]|nr:hypothetical protein [Candidatus Pacearchaeota archaeon]